MKIITISKFNHRHEWSLKKNHFGFFHQLTIWLPNKIFRNCHLAPNKFFCFSPLASNEIFGFSLLASKKFFCRCQQTVQLPPVPKLIQLEQTISPKMAKKCFKGNYITTMYFVLCIVCCVVYCLLCITIVCCANNPMQILSTTFCYFS